MSKRVVIVGGGLFGRMTADVLHDAGHRVTVITSPTPEFPPASPASGGLMKPSWMSTAWSSGEYQEALAVMQAMYPVKTLRAQVQVGIVHKDAELHCLEPEDVLCAFPRYASHDVDHVTDVKPGAVLSTQGVQSADVVIVAAGMASGRLLLQHYSEAPVMAAFAGLSLTYPELAFSESSYDAYIAPWAPYKQVVARQSERGIWVGDGSAIIPVNFSAERQAQSRARCRTFVSRLTGLAEDELAGHEQMVIGHRPSVVGHKGGYLRELAPGLWVTTGGHKNGTMTGMIQALTLRDELARS